MKNFIQYIGPILAIVAAVILFVFTRPDCPDILPPTEENKKLQAAFDSLAATNKGLDSVALIYPHKFDSVYSVSKQREEKIKQLKKAEHEKLATIDSLRSYELYNLFSGLHLNP